MTNDKLSEKVNTVMTLKVMTLFTYYNINHFTFLSLK